MLIFLGEVIHSVMHFLKSWQDAQSLSQSALHYMKLRDSYMQAGLAILCYSTFSVSSTSTAEKIVQMQRNHRHVKKPKLF